MSLVSQLREQAVELLGAQSAHVPLAAVSATMRTAAQELEKAAVELEAAADVLKEQGVGYAANRARHAAQALTGTL